MPSRSLTRELYISKTMEEYKILSQKIIESTKTFEKRLNEVCQQGWKPISLAAGQGGNAVLLQKIDKYDRY